MTVYVDNMQRRARLTRWESLWSHLMADTPEELAEFAGRLGLDPAWLQHAGTPREHYDVVDRNRTRAIAMGAVPIAYGGREQQELLRRKREAMRRSRPVRGLRGIPVVEDERVPPGAVYVVHPAQVSGIVDRL